MGGKVMKSNMSIGRIKISLVTAMMFILIISTSALGEDASKLAFKELQLSYWLEYDQHRDWPQGVPSALTLYNGKFINNGSVPYNGRVEFRIPKDQTIINMACETEQGMVCMPYDVIEEKDYKILSWQPSKPINPGAEYPFMLEFYSNPIQGDGNKTANFIYSSNYQALKLNIDVKQPLKATNFQIKPPQQSSQIDSQGFNTYFYQYSNVKENSNLKIQANYTKADNEPSILPDNTAANQGPVQRNSNNSSNSVIIILIVLAGGVGALLYMNYKTKNKKARTKIIRQGKNNRKRNEIEEFDEY